MLNINGLNIPIVYNTNSYENIETLKLLEGYIDVYLPDIKYFYDESAIKYSKIGFSQSDYAIAFEQVRGEFISKNVWWMLIIGVALIGGAVWYLIKNKNAEKKVSTNSVVFALNSVVHPFDTFYRLKNKGEGSVLVAFGALVLYYISRVLSGDLIEKSLL